MTEEDRFLETLTALVFAGGVLVGIAAFVRGRTAPAFYLIVPACSLLGLLDEISFGQRLFGFELPRLRHFEIDGVHDLFLVTYDVFVTDNPFYLACYVLIPLLALAGGSWLVLSKPHWRGRLSRIPATLRRHPPLPYVALAVFLLFVALTIDLDLVETDWLLFIEELLELNVAVALLFGGLAIAAGRHPTALRGGDSRSTTVPAIVCSAGSPAAVTIAQTLGPQGIPIHALSNMDQPACRFSRYTTICHVTPTGQGGSARHDNVHEPESLLAYLVNHVERGVLIPGTDANVRFLSRHKRRLLDEGFRLCIPDETVLTKAVNKSDLADFCAERGFPVPRTVVVDSVSDLHAVVERLQFPVVLKGVFMKNHAFVSSADELPRAYELFRRRFGGKTDQCRAVAQEWIPGPSERFAKLYVVCDEQSRVVAHHTLRRVRVHVRRDGSQGDTLIAKTEKIEPFIKRWLPFFEAIRWVGVASLECKYDERDGEYKIIEINPRPWAILKVSVDCGVNVPLLYYRLALDEPVARQTHFAEDQYYIRLLWGNIDVPEPWRSLGMLATRQITLREVLRVYRTLVRNRRRVSIDVGSLRDPWPTVACMYYYGVRYFTRWF
jgi:predicted ATP-grasp superfamily ATP-dependent carboligase